MKSRTTDNHAAVERRSAGFTLLELLVAISVILVLVGIGATLGPAMAGQGATQTTRMALSVGESALTEYQALTGRWPDVVDSDAYPYTRVGWDAAADGELGDPNELPVNSAENFYDYSGERFVALTLQMTLTGGDLVALRRHSSLNTIYEDLSADVLTDNDEDGDAGFGFFELRDGWGKKIAYVPPGDPYGVMDDTQLPFRDTPYFVSAGPSGDFDNVEDNIYSYDVVN